MACTSSDLQKYFYIFPKTGDISVLLQGIGMHGKSIATYSKETTHTAGQRHPEIDRLPSPGIHAPSDICFMGCQERSGRYL